MILSEGRTLKVPVVFTREGVDSHNRKTNVFLETSISFKCWEEEGYEDYKLKLVRGRTGRMVQVAKNTPLFPESMLRVYMEIPNEMGSSCQEIDGFLNAKYEGLTISVEEGEKVLSAKEALAKINSGNVMFLTEQLQKRIMEDV